MKVYRQDADGQHFVGIANVEDEGWPTLEVRLFGPVSVIAETFMIGTVTHCPSGDAPNIAVERVILLAGGQRPEVLPGWQAMAS